MAVPKAHRRLPKRTAAQTRDLMLRAAVELIRERVGRSGDDVVAAALAHVRLTQVAERATGILRAETGDEGAAPVTTGAIYQLWPSQGDFQADLLFHIAEGQAALVPQLAARVMGLEITHGRPTPIEKMIRVAMGETVRLHYEDPLFRVELSFLACAGDPRVREAIAHRQACFAEASDAVWQWLLERYRLRPRPPRTVRDITLAVAAQIAGSVVTSVAEPDQIDGPVQDDRWSLASLAALAIVQAFTEPDEPKCPSPQVPEPR